MSEKVIVPPIKCQGIKTKLVPLIRNTVNPNPNGRWIEPFVGTGVVAFNMAPNRALLIDKNQYIIRLYKAIQNCEITSKDVRDFLEYHGSILEKKGKEYYLDMREKFNNNGDPMYFLFLNRSDFNGMIRFNRSGQFNVPFCQKPNRFSKAYITKICNQVSAIANVMKDKDWEFRFGSWRDAFENTTEDDYIYLDPPYIGRDTSYVGEWPEKDAIALAKYSHNTPANVCLSMWRQNEFRRNEYLYEHWSDFIWHDCEHFYHIGAKKSNRHPIMEVLAIKRDI